MTRTWLKARKPVVPSRNKFGSRSRPHLNARRQVSLGAPAGAKGVLSLYRHLYNPKSSTPIFLRAEPFNIIFNSGTAVGAGMGIYTQTAGIPAVPAGNGNFLQFGFQLDSVVHAFGAGGAVTTAAIANVTEYIALWEEFVFDRVEFEMVFSNAPNVAGAAIPTVPTISTVVDPDDMDNFAYATMSQYPSFKVTQFGNSSGTPGGRQKISFKPNFAATYVLANGSTVGKSEPVWLDTATSSARYFGLKMYYNNEDGQARVNYSGTATVFVKIYARFRGFK